MPYCPECLAEYLEGIDKCPDCDAPLLPGSPPEAGDNPNNEVDSVLLTKPDSVMQAKFIAAALEEARIPFVARGLGITDSLGGAAGGDVSWGAYSSPRGPEIYVHPSDLEAAQQVLESIQGSELSEDEETGSDTGGSPSV